MTGNTSCKYISSNINTKSKKANIKNLQQFLIDFKYLTTVSTPNGVYGKATTKALKEFQKIHKLKQTGVVDVETRNVMNIFCVN